MILWHRTAPRHQQPARGGSCARRPPSSLLELRSFGARLAGLAGRFGEPVYPVVGRQLAGGLGRHIDHQGAHVRSEEHTSELQSLMRISYAVFCLNKTKLMSQIYTNSQRTRL